MGELTKKEHQFELELISNYMTYMSKLIASNIATIHKYYDDYPFSFEDVIRMSKDHFQFKKTKKQLFYKLIKKNLKNKYKIEIVSNEKDKLEIKKI